MNWFDSHDSDHMEFSLGQEILSILKMASASKDEGGRITSARRGLRGWRINIRLGRHTTRLPYLNDDQAAAFIGTLGPPRERSRRGR